MINVSSKSNLKKQQVKFLKIRKANQKKLMLCGAISVLFIGLGMAIPHLGIFGFLAVVAYWVIYTRGLKIKCPNCKQEFGLSSSSKKVGDGKHSCLHCGYDIHGNVYKDPDSHDKEWLE